MCLLIIQHIIRYDPKFAYDKQQINNNSVLCNYDSKWRIVDN